MNLRAQRTTCIDGRRGHTGTTSGWYLGSVNYNVTYALHALRTRYEHSYKVPTNGAYALLLQRGGAGLHGEAFHVRWLLFVSGRLEDIGAAERVTLFSEHTQRRSASP